MKYIKTYEFFTIEPTDEYVEKVKKSNDIYEQRKELTEKVINEMNPKCEEVAQNIEDIFQEWVDDGIEFDDVTLSMPSKKSEGDTIGFYYPLGWQGKKEKYYHASFSDDETDKKATQTIEDFNNGCLTYRQLILRLAKSCQDKNKNLHEIVEKYIVSFGSYKPKFN